MRLAARSARSGRAATAIMMVMVTAVVMAAVPSGIAVVEAAAGQHCVFGCGRVVGLILSTADGDQSERRE
jgi:hypothetical protein